MFIYIHIFIHSPGLKCTWLKHPQTLSLGLLKLSAGGARVVSSVFFSPMACLLGRMSMRIPIRKNKPLAWVQATRPIRCNLESIL